MKKYLFLSLIIIGFFNSCQSQEAVIDPTLVQIIDANFEKALINQKIDTDGLLNGQIKRVDAEDVKVLNLSNLQISSLVGIDAFINLTYLDCSTNQLSNIDVAKNLFLQSLDCSTNQIATLDLSKNINLTNLNCANNKLTNLVITGNQVFAVTADNNLLQTISTTNCPKLSILNVVNNQISSLSLLKNLNLIELHCNLNKIKSIDLSQNNRLFYLNISNNILTSLDLCNNTNLSKLYCSSNNLTNITVPQQNLTNFTSNNSTLDAQTKISACIK